MQITIYRGTQEIGGSCIEVATASTRILLDLGMPLVAPWDKKAKLDSRRFDKASVPELLDAGILPRVPGLYTDDGPKPDALILSHPHQDHYGLVRHIRPGIPIYLSDGARRIIAASDIFLPTKAGIREPRIIESGEPFLVGDISITPALVDHSAFGAMAFTVEGGGKRIFYSGDFRGHGRKSALFEGMLRRPPRDLNALLMEGTTLGRGQDDCQSEADLEAEFVRLGRAHAGLKLVSVSGQNIDRLVTLYRAARRLGGFLVVDFYTAFVLDSLGVASLPRPGAGFSNLRVLFTKPHMRKAAIAGHADAFRRFRASEITWREMGADPGRYYLVHREGMTPDLEKSLPLSGAAYLYSQFGGSMVDESFSRTKAFLERAGIPIIHVHTSGHASPRDLARFVKALAPKTLVPIHTFNPEAYASFWPSVTTLSDGRPWEVD